MDPIESLPSRLLVLDTETTGFSPESDRLTDVAVVELVNRQRSGRQFHSYLDPQRFVPDDAVRVHGMTWEDLKVASGGKTFKRIANELWDFLVGATLIIHNARFDMGFLDAEFQRAGKPKISEHVKVFDTLKYAGTLFPNGKKSLDALCARFGIDRSERDVHGAMVDTQILVDVFLAMTTRQVTLGVDNESAGAYPAQEAVNDRPVVRTPGLSFDEDDATRHQVLFERISKSAGCAVSPF